MLCLSLVPFTKIIFICFYHISLLLNLKNSHHYLCIFKGSRQKSPVFIQEWVDSIAINTEVKEIDDVSPHPAECPLTSVPIKSPSHEDDFSLGAEGDYIF